MTKSSAKMNKGLILTIIGTIFMALFAAGHIAAGNFCPVFFDVATIFIDSIIYAYVNILI